MTGEQKNKKSQKHRRSTCFFGRKQKLSTLQKKKNQTCLALYHSKSRHSQGHSQHLQWVTNTDNAHAPSQHSSPSTVTHTYGSSFTARERFTPREDSSLLNQKWHSLKLLCKRCAASPMQTLVGGNQTKRAEETKGPSIEAMWVEKGDKANSTGWEEGRDVGALISWTVEVQARAAWGPQSVCRCSWWTPSPCTWHPSAPLWMVPLSRKKREKKTKVESICHRWRREVFLSWCHTEKESVRFLPRLAF